MEWGIAMNEQQKKRYEELKRKNAKAIKEKEREKGWKSNALLQECLEALGTTETSLPVEEQEGIVDKFNEKLEKLFQFQKEEHGSIDSVRMEDMQSVYLIWDRMDLPVLRTDFASVKRNIIDVEALDFDTWIVSEDMEHFVCLDFSDKVIEYSL